MPLDTEDELGATPLTGMPGQPNKPGRRSAGMGSVLGGDGSIGDDAFRDSVIIVLAAWAVLFFLAYSLRHHNH